MIAPRRRRARPDQEFDARIAQQSETLPGDARVGVFHRADDPGDAGGDDRPAQGGVDAVMRARLQRDIERRAARGLAGFVER